MKSKNVSFTHKINFNPKVIDNFFKIKLSADIKHN